MTKAALKFTVGVRVCVCADKEGLLYRVLVPSHAASAKVITILFLP